jgi:hypothetical protein
MWEMVTGERLFVGESDFSTLEKVRNVEITPPSSYNRRLPEDLEKIILKALSKEVEDRYQTAMDLHDALQSWMYTSGNFFARKDLAEFLTKLFKADIEKEVASQEGGLELSTSTVPPPPKGVLKPGSGRKPMRPGAPPLPPRRSQAPPRPKSSDLPQKLKTGEMLPQPPGATSSGRLEAPRPTKRIGTSSVIPPVPRRTMPGSAAAGARPSDVVSMSGEGLAGVPASTISGKMIQPLPQTSPIKPPEGVIPLDDWDDEEPPTNIYSKKEAAEMARAAVAQEAAFGGRISAGADMGLGLGPVAIPAIEDTREISQVQPRMGRTPLLKVILATALAVISIGAVLFYILYTVGPKTGTLNLVVEPSNDLQVIVDGSKILPGTMSPFKIELSPGEHNISVKHGNYNSRIEVNIEAGKTADQSMNLKASASGFFLETEPPGASVWIDDRPIEEKTPVTVGDLKPGTYMLRIAKGEAYAQMNIEVDVVQGEIKRLPLKVLELKEVEVAFDTSPRGARVTLLCGTDRKNVGLTPVSDKNDTSKDCRVNFHKEGYEDTTVALEYPPGLEKYNFPLLAMKKLDEGRRTSGSREESEEGSSSGSSQRTGTLSVQTRPWSKVYVDGKFIKNTPVVNFEIRAGKHTVTVKNPSYNIDKTFKVVIKPGKPNTLVKTLI